MRPGTCILSTSGGQFHFMLGVFYFFFDKCGWCVPRKKTGRKSELTTCTSRDQISNWCKERYLQTSRGRPEDSGHRTTAKTSSSHWLGHLHLMRKRERKRDTHISDQGGGTKGPSVSCRDPNWLTACTRTKETTWQKKGTSRLRGRVPRTAGTGRWRRQAVATGWGTYT